MEKNLFEIYGNKKEIPQIGIPTFDEAKKLLTQGLRYYVGEKAIWLDEYDNIARWLVDNHHRGLLLFGSNGVGKSVMCTKVLPVIFKYYAKMSANTNVDLCYYTRATDIEGNYEKNLPLRYSPILIIDDIGAESETLHYGTKRDFIAELVDLCEEQSRLLIMTTNLSPDEISEKYGKRTLDRLHSITHAFTIEHESLRR